ncbi:MAG TPA: cytochrome c3 family protein [Acidobacteriota bacterium]|nr:cytochrome c3 family protein [Acidobacteriota bacterium]
MKDRAIRLFAAVALFAPLLAFGQKNSCIACHNTLEDELKAPAAAFPADIHGQYGLSCKECHGGDPTQDDVDKAKDKSFKGAPKRQDIPLFCGRCHADATAMRAFNPGLRTDQLSQYWTSRHGERLKVGDTKVAVCTDCHGVHGIQSAKYPKSLTFPWNIPQTCGRCHADKEYMAAYKLPTSQLEDYKASVHANALYEKKDLSAPVCNSCHGNHGAFPPSVTSVGSVCRQCHPSTGDLFMKSPHKKAFDELGAGECEACHGNHKILPPTTAMIGTDQGAVCAQCHDRGSAGFVTAAEFRRELDGFESGFRAAEDLLVEAKRKGVEVSDAEFKLKDVNTLLVTAKNLTHGLDRAEVAKSVTDGEKALAEVRVAGEKALDEATFRRRGLAVTTALLALFAVALALKIRRMGRASRQADGRVGPSH